MRILFLTNYPSPYRVDFFNELGRQMDLTVAFTETVQQQAHRSAQWFHENYTNFRAVFLRDGFRVGSKVLFRDCIPLIREGFDHILVGGYSEPTQMLAIEYMRVHRIPFLMEADGGMVKKDSAVVRRIKQHFIGAASGWLSSGKNCDDYFLTYGAVRSRIYRYPFTSLYRHDLLETLPRQEEKLRLREKYGLSGKHMVLSIGQFIPRKGMDVLIHAAPTLWETDVCIVGAEPPEEYLLLRKQTGAENVRFLGFHRKEELKELYQAADVFVLPTREDIWGLVINEAMANGLPVVSTDRCVAALELVEDGVNGFVIPTEDPDAITKAVNRVLYDNDAGDMGAHSLEKIQAYTIEEMAKTHFKLLCELPTAH